MENENVYVVLNRSGMIISVHSEESHATANAKRWNDDPYFESALRDDGAPYHVETWHIQESQ